RHYALVVTDAVKDTSGAAVASDAAYLACLAGGSTYCASLARAVGGISAAPQKIVAASLFTTLSATAWLENARAILADVPPVPLLAQPPSTFHLPALSGLTLPEQVGSNPVQFLDRSLPVTSAVVQGLDRLVIGSYRSPNFLEDDQSIRPGPTLPQLTV